MWGFLFIFTKRVFFTCYDCYSVSPSCRKLACIPRYNFGFTNKINSDHLINACLFFHFTMSAHITAKLSTNTHEKFITDLTAWIFVVSSTNTSNSSLRKIKMGLFFPKMIWRNQIKANYVLGLNSKHPLVQMFRPL